VRPEWVEDPRFDLPVAEESNLPPSWFWWSEEERSLYVTMCMADAPMGYQPPVIPSTAVTD
jgi:hypothetical protein